ncbi:MAG TPA: hypothetical protein V6C81_15115 [Planktothrix sp.]|jgi:tetratricopeptide (TPR) repeat protein
MHRLCKTTIVLCLGLINAVSRAEASPANFPELTLGADLASSAHYAEAVPHLQSAVAKDANDATAHYYLGYSLAALNKYMEARSQLEAAISIDGANSVVGRLASDRLKTLKAPPAVPQKTGKADALNSALQTIREQAQTAKDLQQNRYNGWANNVLDTANGRISQLREEQRNQTMNMRNAYVRDEYGNMYPVYTEEQIQAASKKYDEKITIVQQESTEQATNVRNKASGAKDGLDAMADDLAHELTNTKAIPGTPKLSPVGTNLYIRNYVSSPSAPKPATPQAPTPDELAASPDKLILEPTKSPGKFSSHVVPGRLADQDKLLLERKRKAAPDTQLQVTGKMMPPALKN